VSETADQAPIVLIANPHAARGRGARAIAVASTTLRNTGAHVDVRETAGPGDAARLAGDAAREGVSLIGAIGGDGTLHEVANGMLKAGVEALPALGLIPVGGGNDYAKMLGVATNDPHAAAKALLSGPRRPVDVGLLEGADGAAQEYFLNNVGLSYMAVANQAREVARFLPGRASYVAGGVLGMLKLAPERLNLTVDGEVHEGRYQIVHVAIGRYCGAGVCLTPSARHDDGQFEVYLLGQRSKLKTTLQWAWVEKGAPVKDTTWLKGTTIRIVGPPGLLLHADGEIRHAPSGQIDLTLLPGKLQVVHAD
jgi:YegS/Rv2252/BmrU family lipid kinase